MQIRYSLIVTVTITKFHPTVTKKLIIT